MLDQNSVLQAAAPCSKYKDASMVCRALCGLVSFTKSAWAATSWTTCSSQVRCHRLKMVML
jgi:hypothetical protein